MHRMTTAIAVAALAGAAAVTGSQTLVHTSLSKTSKMPHINACPARFDDGLEKDGVVPLGTVPGVTPPKAVYAPDAEFTEKARKEIHKRAFFPYESVSTIDLVVDSKGMPRDLCVQRSAEFDLDKAAAESVWQYRFQPATKDGKPVSKRLAVEVRFAMR